MDKGVLLWAAFIAVMAAGFLISRKIKKGTEEEGIETQAVVSRIADDGTAGEIDINVYVRYLSEDGEEIEGVLSNPRPGLEPGQSVRIKYHPKYKNNARLV